MATALVFSPQNHNRLSLIGSWRKCSAGSAKLVETVQPIRSTGASEAVLEVCNTDAELEWNVQDEEEDEDGFSMDALTERCLEMEDLYSAPAHKARNNFASKAKKAGLQAPRTKPDNSRHPPAFRRTKHATAEEEHERLILWDWDPDLAITSPSVNVDWKRPLTLVREQVATYRMLYKRPSRYARREEMRPRNCCVCYEDFGWHLNEHHKITPGQTYLAMLLKKPDVSRLTYTARHLKCGGEKCEICVDCFRRDLDRQLASSQLLAFSIRSRHLPSLLPRLHCSSCRHVYQEKDLPTILSPAQLELLSDRLLRFALLNSPDVSFCPGINCTNAVVFDLNAPCTLLACPTCPTYWCFVCRSPYHWGRTCKEARAEDTNAAWRAANTKPCPTCHTQIEKNEGCNHMHCTLCDTRFGWSDVEFGEYTAQASQRRVNLPPRRVVTLPERWSFALNPPQYRYSEDDEIIIDDDDDDELGDEDDSVPGPQKQNALKPKWKKRHDAASRRNARHVAARSHRRLVDRFPLLQIAVSVNV